MIMMARVASEGHGHAGVIDITVVRRLLLDDDGIAAVMPVMVMMVMVITVAVAVAIVVSLHRRGKSDGTHGHGTDDEGLEYLHITYSS